MNRVNWLLDEIWKLHQELREDIRREYKRSVPLADELTDRWERAVFLGFGKDANIYDSTLVFGDVKVGNNTFVGPGCVLDGSGGLEIGSYCSVSAGCQIYSHVTVNWALSGGKAEYKHSPTKIGNCCYLGPLSVITMGVKIGEHCLVGANSLVKDDVPDNTFVAGSPARVLGTIEVKENGEVVICPKST